MSRCLGGCTPTRHCIRPAVSRSPDLDEPAQDVLEVTDALTESNTNSMTDGVASRRTGQRSCMRHVPLSRDCARTRGVQRNRHVAQRWWSVKMQLRDTAKDRKSRFLPQMARYRSDLNERSLNAPGKRPPLNKAFPPTSGRSTPQSTLCCRAQLIRHVHSSCNLLMFCRSWA